MNVPIVTVATAKAAIVALAQSGARKALILTGAPGIGKSAAPEQAAAEMGADFYVSNPPVEESVEYRGLPFVVGDGDDARARWLPLGVIEDLQRLATANNGGLIVWEVADAPQAPTSTQAALMQLLHRGEVGGHKLPANLFPVITANRSHDAAGAEHGLLWTIRDRAAAILSVEPDPSEWLSWGASSGIHALILAYIGARPEDLMTTERPSLAVDHVAPSPRGWHRASEILDSGAPEKILSPLLHGRLGESVSSQFLAFRQSFHRLPDLDVVAKDPQGAPLLTGAQDCYLAAAMIANAAARTTDAKRAKAFCEYVARYGGEFQALARTIITGRRPAGDVPGLALLAE